MFYSSHILTKKGALSKVWLAAHMQHKLTKGMVTSVDVEQSCTSIVQPEAPLALRLSSNLMLGVVRIYSKKTKYLLSDCTEAMAKLRTMLRPGAGFEWRDDDNVAAPYAAITLADPAAHAGAGHGALMAINVEPIEDDGNTMLMDLDFLENDSASASLMQHSLSRALSQSGFQASERDITMDDHSSLTGEDSYQSGGHLSGMSLDLAAAADIDEQQPLPFVPSRQRSASPAEPEQLRRDRDRLHAVAPELSLSPTVEPLQPFEFEPEHHAADQRTGLPVPLPLEEDQDRLRQASQDSESDVQVAPPVQTADEDKPRIKRRMVTATAIDIETELPARQIRAQLARTDDIVLPLVTQVPLRDEVIVRNSSTIGVLMPLGGGPLHDFVSKCMESLDTNILRPPAGRDLHAGPGTATETEEIEIMRAATPGSADAQLPMHILSPFVSPNQDKAIPHAVEHEDDRVQEESPDFDFGSLGSTSASSVAPGPAPATYAGSSPPRPVTLRMPLGRISLMEVAATPIHSLAGAPDLSSGDPLVNERTTKMCLLLEDRFYGDRAPKAGEQGARGTAALYDLTADLKAEGATRRSAARAFYEVLNLSTRKLIHLDQAQPYGAIHLTPTAAFNTALVASQ
ncbi:Double-strand-break repair protein rad21-like [Porphyridium purpureum]|uniref:Double-strand-break repair protein rad21-like n=1 Tax=Porphyridium purpureum TaxID=35688 RepID=A0A5J4YJT9_PORPP|nr:Double-strand-break repair protein rad21-like [Porphyridium purpureum]|eukprot:POR3288..scf251_18